MGNTVNIGLLDHSFQHLFEEAPFAAALYAGPEFILEMANETSLNLWRKDSSIIGMPLLKAMPEMENQPLFQFLQKVYDSGTVCEGRERATIQDGNGNPKKVYINYIYKPIRDDEEMRQSSKLLKPGNSSMKCVCSCLITPFDGSVSTAL